MHDEEVRMRAGDRAYGVLLDEIQSGTLAPGTVLVEVEQAARLGVSRTPLREAMARLAAAGLVVQQSPRVTVVSEIDAADIRALFDVRRALEETSARLAAEHGDSRLFAALAAQFATARVDDDTAADEYYDLIARFDARLDAAADNAYLTSALGTVRAHLVRVRRLARTRPPRLAASVAEHRLIAEAIAARDAELAAHATHVHLHNALTSILAAITDTAHTPQQVPDRAPQTAQPPSPVVDPAPRTRPPVPERPSSRAFGPRSGAGAQRRDEGPAPTGATDHEEGAA